MESTVERSFSPGIREYSTRTRRSFSNRPIGCFAVIGCCILVAGIGMVLWEARSRPKLELNNWYAIMRTLGTTFVSLGLFVFLVSTILMCETVLSERSARRRSDDEESGSLNNDIQISRDYGTRWEPPLHKEFLHRSMNETSERKSRGMVRCVSDSHFGRRTHSRSRDLVDHHLSNGDFRYETKSGVRSPPSSPTYKGHSPSYNWPSFYDRPAPIHRKEKRRKEKSKLKSRCVSASWAHSGSHYSDMEKIHKPRLRVSLSEEAIEDTSSNDSPDSGHPGSEFSVNRNNTELLNFLVEKGILTSEDFRHYFTSSAPTGSQVERPKDRSNSMPIKKGDKDMAVAGHSRPVLLRHKNAEPVHNLASFKMLSKRSENREVPSQNSPLFATSSWDRTVPCRALFTIGERTRTSSTSDWRTESDAGQESAVGTSSSNLTSQLSNSLPHLHAQNNSETMIEDLQAFESATGANAYLNENFHVDLSHQHPFKSSEDQEFDAMDTSRNVPPFERATNEHVHESQVCGHAEDVSLMGGESTASSASLDTSEHVTHY